MHSARASLFVVFLAALVTASCSDSNLGVTQPTGVGESKLTVEAIQTNVTTRSASESECPSVSPFTAGVGVLVRVAGDSTIVITGISMQFTDVFGIRAPLIPMPGFPVTLPAPGPTQQFGLSTPELLQRSRQFTLDVPVGCGIGRQGTIAIFVDTIDGRGRRSTERVKVTVD